MWVFGQRLRRGCQIFPEVSGKCTFPLQSVQFQIWLFFSTEAPAPVVVHLRAEAGKHLSSKHLRNTWKKCAASKVFHAALCTGERISRTINHDQAKEFWAVADLCLLPGCFVLHSWGIILVRPVCRTENNLHLGSPKVASSQGCVHAG